MGSGESGKGRPVLVVAACELSWAVLVVRAGELSWASFKLLLSKSYRLYYLYLLPLSSNKCKPVISQLNS